MEVDSSEEDSAPENVSISSPIVLSSDDSDDDIYDIVVVGEKKAPQTSEDDSDDVVFVSMHPPAPAPNVPKGMDRSSVECVELCSSPVKAVSGEDTERGTPQLSNDDRKDKFDEDLDGDRPINLVKVSQDKSGSPSDTLNSNVTTSSRSPCPDYTNNGENIDVSRSMASPPFGYPMPLNTIAKPSGSVSQPFVSAVRVTSDMSPSSDVLCKPGNTLECLTFKNWLLPGSAPSQTDNGLAMGADICGLRKPDLLSANPATFSSKPLLHKSLSFTADTSSTGASTGNHSNKYQADEFITDLTELLALDGFSLPTGTSTTRSDSSSFSPGPRIKRLKSDSQLTEKVTAPTCSDWNTMCIVCGQTGRKVSCCMQCHQTCSMCLEERVKNVLCGQIEGQLKCLALACDSFYPMSELKHSLPPMVVEILETRLEKFYVDYLADMMLKDAPGVDKAYPHPGSAQEPMDVSPIEKKKGNCDLPDTWDEMDSQDPFMMVELEPESMEYISVALKFHESMMFPRSDIEKIFRVQNPILWKFYSVKKQQMILDNDGLDVNDLLLFHGTGNEAVEAICKSGFDWRLCGKNGTLYGQGSYFAKGASYSHQYCTRSSALSTDVTSAKLKSLQYKVKRMVKLHAKQMQQPSPSTQSTLGVINTANVNVANPNAIPGVNVSRFQQFVVGSPVTGKTTNSYQLLPTTMVASSNNNNNTVPMGGGVCPNVSIIPPAGMGSQNLLVSALTPTPASNSQFIVSVQVPPPNVVWSGGSACATHHVAQLKNTQSAWLLSQITSSSFSQTSGSFAPTMVPLPLAAPLNLSTNTSTTNSTTPNPTSSSGAPHPGGIQVHVPPLVQARPPPSYGLPSHNSSLSFVPYIRGSSSAVPQQGATGTSTLPDLLQDSVPTYRMFLARVLVGKFTGGNSSFRKPPPLNQHSDRYGKCYDSCVDNVFNPSIYVIFDLAQAYPEYIVQYKMNF